MLNIRVLVIDDSHVARRLLVSQLRELGFKDIVECEDGAVGLEKVHESRKTNKPFGLILTDLRMPKVSGADFLLMVNADPESKLIPKLIISVETDRGTVLNAVLQGADGYILKPTTTPVLKAKLDKLMSQKKVAS